jgi:hypothetical protein
MNSKFSFIVSIALTMLSMQAIQAEGFFKWKDARGNTQYGDKPPENAKAKRFKMPEITVIEGYGKQWKPLDGVVATKSSAPIITNKTAAAAQAKTAIYTKFVFVAPRNNQIIRGGFNGEVSAMLSIKPPLKKGHQIAFSLDGKEVSRSSSRTKNFSSLAGGAHTVAASIVDKSGNIIMSGNSVAFNVIRKLGSK